MVIKINAKASRLIAIKPSKNLRGGWVKQEIIMYFLSLTRVRETYDKMLFDKLCR